VGKGFQTWTQFDVPQAKCLGMDSSPHPPTLIKSRRLRADHHHSRDRLRAPGSAGGPGSR